MSKTIDYIIVGQGLAGSALAWELLQRGKSVMVFDRPGNNRASAVAAGLFNPITGKVLSKSWKAEKIFPTLEDFYHQAERILNGKFLQVTPVYRPFSSEEERNLWREKIKLNDLEKFISRFNEAPSEYDHVHDPFGGIEIAHAGYLKVAPWLLSVRKYLQDHEGYRDEYFEEDGIIAEGEKVRYKELSVGKIIFCNGLEALESKWFGYLPIKPLKGETLEIKMASQSRQVFNRGVYLVPTEEEGRFKVGATYQHPPFSDGPTDSALEELTRQLRQLISTPFEVIHQDWGIRPTTPDRRPLLGYHPANKNVIIFNGVGTKGVSLAPYFAQQLIDWLDGRGDLEAEVNINRFKALYSR